jgi:hypothetical protein
VQYNLFSVTTNFMVSEYISADAHFLFTLGLLS